MRFWRTLVRLLFQLAAIPVIVLFLYTVSFALVNLIPTDPARIIAGDGADAALLAQVRRDLGIDLPIPDRYVNSLGALLHGDLGKSYFTKRPVVTEFAERAASSLELVVLSLAVAVVYGVALGGAAAYFENRWPDRVARTIIAFTQSVPDFLIGVLLIFVVFYVLRLAPAPVGQLAIADALPPRVSGAALIDSLLSGRLDTALSALAHVVLPVLTLGVFIGAFFAKTTRASMSEALRGPASEFARACGLSEWRVFWWSFRLTRTPLVTYIGLVFAALLGGAAIIEILFAWNGLGQWALKSIISLDVPVIQGFVLIVSSAALAVYMLTEVVVVALDPRLSFGGRR